MIFRNKLFSITCLLSYVKYTLSSSISFCDGPGGKIEKSREQCSSGYNFGEKRPDCVCIKGIYRIWTDTCDTADGFAEEVCTKLHDPTTSSNIVGLKLTKDPVDWSQTGAVCERKSFGTESWDLITENSRGSSTKNNNFYAMNGAAFIKDDKICVEPAELPEDTKICKYFKEDNKDLWKSEEVEIEVKKGCMGTLMKSRACFGVLHKIDSECQLPCQQMSRSMSAAPPKIKGRGTTPTKGKSMTSSSGAGGENITNPADYRKHDNKFLNRKMLVYNVISQIEGSHKGAHAWKLPYGEPLKTFELFDLMKNITKEFCPSDFVDPQWVELAVDLFYILHKGNVYRYEEPLNQEQYEWIKSILTECHTYTTKQPIALTSQNADGAGQTNPACGVDTGGKATGYCNGTDSKGCNFRPIVPTADHANASYHYVPDVAWDVVDLIQVACFKYFNSSYRMFHVLEQAAEKLFTLQVKNLWYYPGWSTKTKIKLLGAAADLQMYNLEVCVESAYDKNGKIPRLVRPTPPKYLRKKRSALEPIPSVGKNTDVYCSKTKKDFIFPQKCGHA